RDVYDRADRVAVPVRTYQFQTEPVIPVTARVSQQERLLPQTAHQDIYPPVVIEIRKRGAAISRRWTDAHRVERAIRTLHQNHVGLTRRALRKRFGIFVEIAI